MLIGGVWSFPIKISLFKASEKFIKNNESAGNSVVLCHVDQVTGPLWKLEESYTVETNESHINIIGNTPDLWLKKPIYCYDTDFLFAGYFVDEITFYVQEWKTCGWIYRRYEMLPLYPPYGFNIFEKRL